MTPRTSTHPSRVDTVVLRPCAKINLTLRVGERRSDGFHDVRTVLQSIALADRLTLTVQRGPFSLVTASADVPSGGTNLVWRAARLLWQALERRGEPSGVAVRLDKHIPVAAGLGGGSANAAAALAGLNQLWKGRQTRHQLAKLGSELGSDVPFFFQGGTALGVGRGDELYPIDDVPPLQVVLIKPSFGVATADAYRWLDDDREQSRAAASAGQVKLDLGWPAGPLALVNDLQGPVSARHAVVGEMIDALTRAGAAGAAMTGSGSAVFGLFAKPIRRAVLGRLQRPEWSVILTRTLGRGAAGRRLGL
jgi:4-diphosphocytidyl-2-C-methyl-D-erythritol kinase